MRILDRYTLKPILQVFFSCIFIFLFLYCMIDILTHLDDILRNKTGIVFLARYYVSFMPTMFVQVSPFACLLSTLYAFGTLNHNNEVIAMRSSGLSIFSVTKTAVVFGAVISLLIFWMNDRFIPNSKLANEELRVMMEDGKRPKEKTPEVITNLSMYGLKNRLFFINKFIVKDSLMDGVIILEHDIQHNLIKKTVATRGVYEKKLWKFSHSVTYTFDHTGKMINDPVFEEEEIMTIPETPEDFVNQRQNPEFMTIAQLDDYIWRLSKSGASTVARTLKVDLFQRFTSPFTSAIIVFLGIPFAMMMKKRATGLSSIGISIVVGFFYYIVDAVSIALGKGGILPPLVAASLSHIVALSWSVYLISLMP